MSWWLSQLMLERGRRETLHLEGFLINLAKKLLDESWLILSQLYTFSLMFFAHQDGPEPPQICLAGVQTELASPSPCLVAANRMCAPWSMPWECWPGDIQAQKWEMAPAGGAGMSLDTAERVGESKCRKVSALMLSPFLWGCVWVPQHMACPFLQNWVSM